MQELTFDQVEVVSGGVYQASNGSDAPITNLTSPSAMDMSGDNQFIITSVAGGILGGFIGGVAAAFKGESIGAGVAGGVVSGVLLGSGAALATTGLRVAGQVYTSVVGGTSVVGVGVITAVVPHAPN